jgi:formamidopyrimidine-DNA glycosylase
MPELAEVYYFAKRWEAGIGHRVTEVLVHAEKRVFKGGIGQKLAGELEGHALKLAWTHGKQMLFGFEGGRWLAVHLGMTGELKVEAEDFAPGKHDHLVLRQKGRSLVFEDPRLFGAVKFDKTGSLDDPPPWWKALPPGVLDKAFTPELVAKSLKRRAKTPLKSALLDQDLFPGIGNWMADEAAWQARLPPTLLSGELTGAETARLHEVLRAICELSLKTVGKDWADPPPGWLFHERWAKDRPCPQTGRPLTREDIGGRTTCWSAAWQTRPARFHYDVAEYEEPKFTGPEKAPKKRPATESPLTKKVRAK